MLTVNYSNSVSYTSTVLSNSRLNNGCYLRNLLNSIYLYMSLSLNYHSLINSRVHDEPNEESGISDNVK